MNNRAEVHDFLTSRRAKVTPEQAGIPAAGPRRVPGLRRGEVAALAGVSVEYYAKLERGALAGVSAGVLEAIARALRLDDAERAHLLRLAQEANGTPNFARFTFLSSTAHRFYPDWNLFADMTVANLRTTAGIDPHDKDLHDLVGELSTRSDDFRRRWGAHNVRIHGTGVKHFRHHVVGDLELAYETMDLVAERGLIMTIYAAEPGSPTAHNLTLLASWAATSAVPS